MAVTTNWAASGVTGARDGDGKSGAFKNGGDGKGGAFKDGGNGKAQTTTGLEIAASNGKVADGLQGVEQGLCPQWRQCQRRQVMQAP